MNLTNHTNAQCDYLCAKAMGLFNVNTQRGRCIATRSESPAFGVYFFSPTSDNAHAMELHKWMRKDGTRVCYDTDPLSGNACVSVMTRKGVSALGEAGDGNEDRAIAECAIHLALAIGALTEEQVMEVVG